MSSFDRPISQAVNFPVQGVAPGASARHAASPTGDRPTFRPRPASEFPTSSQAISQADGEG